MLGFKTDVLMNNSIGKLIGLIGGILMGIQNKFWIGMLIYTIISWYLAFSIMRTVYA